MKDKLFSYEIRWAKKRDWEPAMDMIWRTFLRFEAKDYTEEGIQNFREFIEDGELYQRFKRGEYQVMVVLDEGRIIGAGSLRNTNHLSLLFVDEKYHRQGIGKRIIDTLCCYLYDEVGEHSMTVMAAPYAVGFYEKMGFRIVVEEREIAGIFVTSMEKCFHNNS